MNMQVDLKMRSFEMSIFKHLIFLAYSRNIQALIIG